MTSSLAHAEAQLPNAAISALGLVKQFGRFAALRGVSETFEPAKLYVILGDNGAGKTTLLRTFAGLASPTKGTLKIFGKTDLRSVADRIGYMAHPSMLYDEMSAIENMLYFARLYGTADASRCAAVLSSVMLDAGLKRPVGQYSQGMRQRTSLARAILHEPQLLLLDEPFSNVDLASGKQMAGLVAGMRDKGKTILLTTHQPRLVDGIADEFIMMRNGMVVGRDATIPE